MNYQENNISLIRANINSQSFDSGTIDFASSLPFSNLFYPFLLDNGGNYGNISLTIDILSKSTLENKFPNEKWVSENRRKNSLMYDNIKWGFKETNHISKDSRAISNAFCFSGQKLSFYIVTKGHDTGYIDNTYGYCKTTLIVSVLDLMTGIETALSTFSNFSSTEEELTRYFQWTVPDINYDTFNSYGLFGMFVIKLDITREIFKDAQRTIPLDTDYPNKSQALLQLLAYSAPHELMTVSADNINVLVSPITWHSTYTDIFKNSVFSLLEPLNQNVLTDDQKRSIIADQAAVLFISQHPVVTADFYPSKIIGFGAEQAIRPQYIFDEFMSKRTLKTLETIAVDRLYGMIATYKAFNYIADINSNFSNFSQSQQVLRDPQKSVIVDENEILDQEYGINGIQFNPYIVELDNSEIIKESYKSLEYSILLSPNNIEIDNIKITRGNGKLFTIDNYSGYQEDGEILISFNVVKGEENIKRIRYSIWSKNNLENYDHVDSTGVSRQHIFSVRRLMGLSLGVSYGIDFADTVFGRIDIEDLDGNVTSFSYEKLLPEPVFDSNTKSGISSIAVLQRQDGSGLVDINYNYFGLSTINASNVSALVSSNGVSYKKLLSDSLRGDIGNSIYTGDNRIIWSPAITFANISEYFNYFNYIYKDGKYEIEYPIMVYIKLILSDADNNENIGVNNAIGIINLKEPDIVLRRLSIAEEYPNLATSINRIALLDEYADTTYYYLINGIISSSENEEDAISIDYRIILTDINANKNYYYIVNGKISTTKKYLTTINKSSIAIVDEYSNASYYSIKNGKIVLQ